MLGIKLIDKVPNLEIRQRTKINDILEEITKLKWKWAGHVARMKDNRWTVRCTEWQVRDGRRSKGRPKRRWRDDIQQWLGATWSKKAKVERSGGGLLPAVEGHSQGTRRHYVYFLFLINIWILA